MKRPLLLALLCSALTLPALAALESGKQAPDFSAPASLAGHEFEFSLKEALGKGPSEIDLETKFRRLEGKAAPGESPAAAPELDDEIARLKKKIRIGS